MLAAVLLNDLIFFCVIMWSSKSPGVITVTNFNYIHMRAECKNVLS